LLGDIYFVGLDVFLGGICLRDFICLGFGLLDVDDGETAESDQPTPR